MAERKRRGLGRGLGALIPDAATSERPVDVFFSGGDSEDSAANSGDAPKSTRTTRKDPAASMQSSRRRKPKEATGAPVASGSASGAKTSTGTKKTVSAGSKAASAPKAGSTSAKAGSAGGKADATGAKTSATGGKAGGTGTKAASRVGAASKTTKNTTRTSSTKRSTAAEKSVREGENGNPQSAAAPAKSRVEETPTAEREPVSVEGSSAPATSSSPGIADSESVEDVRETYPGVYSSAGHVPEDDKSEDEVSEVSDVPESSGEADSVADLASETEEDVELPAGMESIPDTQYGEVEVELIDPNPRQPRTVFDEDQLTELVHSIREIGVLQPVVVRQKPGDSPRYELIMGERRLRATKEAGLATIPAIIRHVDDTDLLRDALLENLHRAELNPLEEAAAYGQLLEDFGCTQEELSERIGRSRPQISNTLRLLRLPPLVQRRVAAGVISAGHARAILGLKQAELMEVLAQRIVAEGLSVRASEEAVVLLNRGDSVNVSRGTSKVAPEFIEVAERLGDRLDTKVNITVGKRKGKLSVEFANQEDLDRILGLLGISGN